MVDSLLFACEKAKESSNIEEAYGVMPGKYLLATLHRAENTDVSHRLSNILEAFSFINTPILFPMHPRTRKAISEFGFDEKLSNPLINIIQPVGYLDMVLVEQSARMILTDSGGIQKEAYVLKVPCITLRDETEWVETVQTGWNILVGADIHQIVDAVKNFQEPADHPQLYGDGNAGQRIIDHILNYQS
jgi:UDP-N-acetylglucosamine 2-epimerase